MIKNKINIEQASVLYLQAMKDMVAGQSYNYRLGQGIYNLLHQNHKELADEIHGTKFDTFHQDAPLATEVLFKALVDYKEEK